MRPLSRALVTALVLCGTVPGPAHSQARACDRPTTLLVVRHADRQGSDDALSEAGRKRALELARVASEAGVRAVYHSDTERTRLTAEPLVRAAGIEPVVYPAKDTRELVRRVLGEQCGGVALVVGHSNTVPLIIAAAGGPALPDLAEDRYDDLFVVTVVGAHATVTHLKYGAASK